MGDKVSWASRLKLCCPGILLAKWDPRNPYPITFLLSNPRTNTSLLTLILNLRVPNPTPLLSKCKVRGTLNKKNYKTDTRFTQKKKKKKKKNRKGVPKKKKKKKKKK